MKKAILIVIVAGMLGFAVYDFVSSSDKSESTVTKEQESEEEASDNKITSPPPEEEEEDVVASDVVGLDKGQIAPDFELTTLDGETVKLSDYRGKRVMLNFWATWCPPCRAEMPDMQKFHEDKDVVILAVNLRETESNTEKVQAFIDERDLTFPVLLDEETVVADQYQIQPIPSSFLIDSDGRIHNKAFGALNYDLMVQEFEKMQ
ncbi:peroxiredoxin [Virgibacillus halotolerans]|uniref:peroxiredoxin family protein n=1 Tax=Virgibacillus halotolerans TaxID=1071053 RepID=UPI00195F57D5|nr:TlpA disulfide reductase family protein [Virgibacillus halotolerans]MBM7600892.1 peroxiredoxin [Virgibacillus halotolerans]